MGKQSRRAGRQKRTSENGIARTPRFTAILNGVTPIDPSGAILPIVRSVDGGQSGQIIGTGFFVAHGLVITAGHVVDVAVDDSSKKIRRSSTPRCGASRFSPARTSTFGVRSSMRVDITGPTSPCVACAPIWGRAAGH
ncbi:hypothetical protein PQR75_45475 [Paraburkholderia fungorum]|uniref:hypothetical protein n=1 Tax=Paraburkholderia fungorum TaxID=134537 RepID=UPI0038B9B2D9